MLPTSSPIALLRGQLSTRRGLNRHRSRSLGSLQTDASHHRYQLSMRDPQIRQRKQCREPCASVRPCATASIRRYRLPLDGPKRKFDRCRHARVRRFDFADRHITWIESVPLVRSHCDLPVLRRGFGTLPPPLEAGVVEDDLFCAVPQPRYLRHAAGISRNADVHVSQFRVGIRIEMGFPTEMPVNAFTRVAHVGGTLSRLFIRCVRYRDQRRIVHHCVPVYQSTPIRQVAAGSEELHGYTMLREPLTKAHDRALVWRRMHRAFQTREPSVQQHIVQRLVHSQIAESEPLRPEVNTGPGRNMYVYAQTVCLGLRLARLDEEDQSA